MSDRVKAVSLLRVEIDKTRKLLRESQDYFQYVRNDEIVRFGKTKSTALIVAQILENFYTCLETFFLRISQFFENSLRQERWRHDLLEKMTLAIPGIRPAVISSETYRALEELLRFRHFKRYYFELDFDWAKLDFLTLKYDQVYPSVLRDIESFDEFLRDIAGE